MSPFSPKRIAGRVLKRNRRLFRRRNLEGTDRGFQQLQDFGHGFSRQEFETILHCRGVDMKIVALPTADGGAAEYARGLLARCEAGEVLAVTAVEFQPGGRYLVQGSAVRNRLEEAGALLEAAVTRLQQESPSDG
jgi:hypothetical protein